MSERIVKCWGDCGTLLVFLTDTNRPGSRAQPYEAQHIKPDRTGKLVRHACRRNNKPAVFLDAMVDFFSPVQCKYTGRNIYAVPTIRGIVWFEQLHPWKSHRCPEHSQNQNNLPDVWDFPQEDLLERSKSIGKVSELVVICCAKFLPPPYSSDPMKKYLVAMKTLTGKKRCIFIDGSETISVGDLAVVSDSGGRQRMITANNSCVFESDGSEKPELLGLPHSWLGSADGS